jgi:osmotically-inducible protein OsmY
MHDPPKCFAWLALGFCVIAFGCSREAADPSPPHRKVSREVQEESTRSEPSSADVDLSRRVREAIMADGQIAPIAPSVEILVTRGEVTLRGTVQDEKARTALIRAAQQIAGLSNVINHLELARP